MKKEYYIAAIKAGLIIISLVSVFTIFAGCSDDSGGRSGTDVPDAPGAATLTPGDSQITAVWTTVNDAASYEVWYHTTNDSAAASKFGSDVTSTGTVITGLANGTTYYVWLKSKNTVGSSEFGPVASGMPVTTGTKINYSAESMTFNMVYIPGGMTFPTGTNDDSTSTVANAYWIGETEVTYEQWQKLYTWATHTDRGANIYSFAHTGVQGDGTGDTGHHPVTTINWRDAMVWCNALTEWYNAASGTSYACVYTSDSGYTTPIRTATDSMTITWDTGSTYSGTEDEPYVNPDAKGFRLASSNEWELAARYRDGTLWTYGDHASGDNSGACYDDGNILGGLSISTVFGDYAVYDANSGSSTAVVKSKTTGNNALGLYDISGNVWEWCFDWHPDYIGSNRVLRGGSWHNDGYLLQVGLVMPDGPWNEFYDAGFRFARTH